MNAHQQATEEQLNSWIEEAQQNGSTHILSVSDIRKDRPEGTPQNYPVFAYGVRDLLIVLEYYEGKIEERIMKMMKLMEDGSVDKNFLFAIMEKD